ncbi:hypothetical protein HDU93_001993, partial [Gonapodya sp. JEL0774]
QRSKDICSAGTPVVLEAMKRFKVPKIVCVTSFGTGDSWPDVSLLLKPLIWYFIGSALADKEIQEQQIKNSGVPFVVVRPGGLNNAARTGVYRVAEHIPGGGSSIPRADVADFCLKLATDEGEWGKWVGKTPTQVV